LKSLLLSVFILIAVASCAQKNGASVPDKDTISFSIQSDYSSYPDLNLKIYLKKNIGDSLLKSIPHTIKEQIPDAYISGIVKEKQYYFLMIDFQDMAFDAGTHSLEQSFLRLKKINNSLGIEKIIVE